MSAYGAGLRFSHVRQDSQEFPVSAVCCKLDAYVHDVITSTIHTESALSGRGTKKTTADKTTAEAEPVGNGISPEERELAKPAMSYDHYQERVSAQPYDHQVKLEGVYATSIGTGQGRDEAERNGPTQSMSQLRNGSEKQSRSMAETGNNLNRNCTHCFGRADGANSYTRRKILEK